MQLSKDLIPVLSKYPYRFFGIIMAEGEVEVHCLRDAYIAAMVAEEFPVDHVWIRVKKNDEWIVSNLGSVRKFRFRPMTEIFLNEK